MTVHQETTGRRRRPLGGLAVLITGAVLGLSLDSVVARAVVLVLTVAATAVVIGRRAPPTRPHPSSAAEERDDAADQRDHAADQRDQAADHRDEAAGQRDSAADQRDQAADLRDHGGKQRDDAGERRDRAADRRDEAADLRDRAGEQFDEADEHDEQPAAQGTGRLATDGHLRSTLARQEAADDRSRASQDREAGASERTEAEVDRGTALADRAASATERTHSEAERDTALADRGASATERTHAGLDRDSALTDRRASADERASASIDGLTGVYLRSVGFIELEHEVDKAHRTAQPLVLAFVDVDHLKDINDSRGHAAGDRMLREVATTLRTNLRSYDLVFRYGGDEFVCALSGLPLAEATKRLAHVNTALAVAPEHGSVTVGLAQLRPAESADAVVARADAALLEERLRNRRTPR
ncbi:GGDEF domain-containing protein [Pengzhenrongella sp.]|jgi:diguanylate cyclase (GGDEF)-like protein|uniref:GGDEF domain-containing protein n=1 Tax=Pengzhenrongella sp. TaxID=2888820 RepID=UPI002F94D246